MPVPAPTEYNTGAPLERFSAERRRRGVATESAGYGAGATAAAMGATMTGNAKIAGTKIGQHTLTVAEHKLKASGHPAAHQVGQVKRLGKWTAAHRGRATGVLAGATTAAGGLGVLARMRANEEAGMSHGIGQIKAGESYARTTQRTLSKGLLRSLLMASDTDLSNPKLAAAWATANKHRKPIGLATLGAAGAATTVGSIKGSRNRTKQSAQMRTMAKSEGHHHGANALLGVGGAAALTGASTNRIANNLNAANKTRVHAKVDPKIAALNSAYGLRDGKPVADPRVVYPKDSAGRTVYHSKVSQRRIKTAAQVLVKDKHRALHALKHQRANTEVLGGNGRSRLMRGSIALAVPAVWAGARGSVDKAELRRRDMDAAVLGGAAAGGGYTAAGFYGPKSFDHKAEAKIAEDPALRAKDAAHRTASGLPKNAHAGDKAYKKHFRTYPLELPGGRLKRIISHTHTGRTGSALTVGVAGAGAYGATKLSQDLAKSYDPSHNQVFTKSYGSRDRSNRQILATGVGAGLGAWGASRSPMIGAALARGIRMAAGKDTAAAADAVRLAQSAFGVANRVTGRGERAVRQIARVDAAVRRVPESMRPGVATTAGLLLMGNNRGRERTGNSNRQIRIRVRPGGFY